MFVLAEEEDVKKISQHFVGYKPKLFIVNKSHKFFLSLLFIESLHLLSMLTVMSYHLLYFHFFHQYPALFIPNKSHISYCHFYSY